MSAGNTGINISSSFDGIYWGKLVWYYLPSQQIFLPHTHSAQRYSSYSPGTMVATTLVGITVAQSWTYLNNNTDPWYLRILVTPSTRDPSFPKLNIPPLGWFPRVSASPRRLSHNLKSERLLNFGCTGLDFQFLHHYLVRRSIASSVPH